MIKKLRRQFVITTMAILLVVFSCILIGLNVVFKDLGARQQLDILKDIAASESIPTNEGQNKRPPHFDYMPVYTFKLDEENNVLARDASDKTADFNSLETILEKAIDHKKKDGFIDNYAYFKTDKPYGSFIVLVDSSNSVAEDFNSRLFYSTLRISLVGLVIIFGASIFLSKFVVKPAEAAFNKQKQFISDASHELKTPLSTIAVNANVVAGEIKDNKHMNYILAEVTRMDGLIKQLLDLSKLEDEHYQLNRTPFCLSDALYQIALPFESNAYERKIIFNLNIQEKLDYNGDETSIKQLMVILLDNAFKYVDEEGTIDITLGSHKNRIKLEITNTGLGIQDNDLPHVFERFYRADTSRANPNGSYGLGLAIAKDIVEKHSGTINAYSKVDQWAKFEVVL